MDLAANENKSITQLLEKCVSNAENGGEDAAVEKNSEKPEEDSVEVAEGKWDGEKKTDIDSFGDFTAIILSDNISLAELLNLNA